MFSFFVAENELSVVHQRGRNLEMSMEMLPSLHTPATDTTETITQVQ
jgi:hypothetical protein